VKMNGMPVDVTARIGVGKPCAPRQRCSRIDDPRGCYSRGLQTIGRGVRSDILLSIRLTDREPADLVARAQGWKHESRLVQTGSP
jgi:hypothetical protein